ncbi:uroporphyrinogen-III synthase [Streptomyces sp. NPDC091281]|uniref:uroporphyrinogen-III synthase n=1 Tax=Streptomyces sp. NPDC091281 TaxID=3365985 RepID=UPI00380A7F78
MYEQQQRGGGGVLAGFTVGVTAARRVEVQVELLRGRGAAVLRAPSVRIVPLADDGELLAVTQQLVSSTPDVVVATTATGFRGWLVAADERGIGTRLRARLRAARIVARGPRVAGAVRAAGLTVSAEAGASWDGLVERLVADGVDGRRVAVQVHGEPPPGLVAALREAGADVVAVPVHRWTPPADVSPLDRLLDAVLAHGVDAVTFTSAPAAASLLARAEERGLLPGLLAAFRQDVLAACVGPVTARPLRARGVDPAVPERYRLGPLTELLCRELPRRARTLPVAGRQVEIRGHAVLVDGLPRPVPPAGMALLRALSRRPGWVVNRAELLRALPGTGRDEHAVETAMARLRSALGAPDVIQTVVKRGYRLALDPAALAAGPRAGASPAPPHPAL